MGILQLRDGTILKFDLVNALEDKGQILQKSIGFHC